MSAYLCNPEHIAALAAFAARGRRGGGDEAVIHEWDTRAGNFANAASVAAGLAEANIRSVAYRYPNDKDGERPGPSMKDADYTAFCAKVAQRYAGRPPALRPVDILSLCAGYEYQACEDPNWRESLAARQMEWIRNKATRALPGYDDAPWSFNDRTIYEGPDALWTEPADV